MTTDTKSIEERRRQILDRQGEVRSELEGLQEERSALAPEVADGHEDAADKATDLSGRIAAARERLAIYDDALKELARREEAELVASEEEAREELRVRYDSQADRRAGLEEKAQDTLEQLATVLDELDEVDTEQRWLSSEIGEGGNQSRFPTDFVVGNWLEARLSPHMAGATARPEFLKPLYELNPLDTRARRPPEVAEAREREALEASERAEWDRLEHDALGRSSSMRERYEGLMGRFMGEDSEARRLHERKSVVPVLIGEFGVEAVRAALVGYEPGRPGASGEERAQ